MTAMGDIINHLDSTFGILLVALVFLTNITIGMIQRHGGQGFLPDAAAIGLGVITSMGVLIGLLGMLVRSLFWKCLGWFLVFFAILTNVAFQAATLVAVFAGGTSWLGAATLAALSSAWSWPSLVVMMSAVAWWLAYYVTLDQYRNRLTAAYFKDDELEDLMASRKKLVVLLLGCICVVVLILVMLHVITLT